MRQQAPSSSSRRLQTKAYRRPAASTHYYSSSSSKFSLRDDPFGVARKQIFAETQEQAAAEARERAARGEHAVTHAAAKARGKQVAAEAQAQKREHLVTQEMSNITVKKDGKSHVKVAHGADSNAFVEKVSFESASDLQQQFESFTSTNRFEVCPAEDADVERFWRLLVQDCKLLWNLVYVGLSRNSEPATCLAKMWKKMTTQKQTTTKAAPKAAQFSSAADSDAAGRRPASDPPNCQRQQRKQLPPQKEKETRKRKRKQSASAPPPKPRGGGGGGQPPPPPPQNKKKAIKAPPKKAALGSGCTIPVAKVTAVAGKWMKIEFADGIADSWAEAFLERAPWRGVQEMSKMAELYDVCLTVEQFYIPDGGCGDNGFWVLGQRTGSVKLKEMTDVWLSVAYLPSMGIPKLPHQARAAPKAVKDYYGEDFEAVTTPAEHQGFNHTVSTSSSQTASGRTSRRARPAMSSGQCLL